MTEILTNLLIGIVGIVFIVLGAELTVNRSQRLARMLGVSEFFIGLTILSVGTSLPEITTHIVGSLSILKGISNIDTLSGLVVGTNIGSNLVQITLITGMVGLLGVIHTTKDFMKENYLIMLASIALLFLFSVNKFISQIEGLILVVLYLSYLIFLSRKEHLIEKIEHDKDKWSMIKTTSLILFGITILIFAADKVLESAIFFSEKFNISGSLIGTLVIGVCTALPEFTTAVTALLKKSSGMGLGTLVGSNITNPLLALGTGAAISGYTIANPILWFDLPFWFFISILVGWFFWRKLELKRPQAIIMILSYIVFVLLRLAFFA